MKIHHVLSVEIEEVKRQFIIDAHTPAGKTPEFCLFDDVAIFQRPMAYCYTCCKEHSPCVGLDVLFTGPSCKNCSYEFSNRASFADCYSTHDGTSGSTYQLGYKKAIELLCPAVASLRTHRELLIQSRMLRASSKGPEQRREHNMSVVNSAGLRSKYMNAIYTYSHIYIYLFIYT